MDDKELKAGFNATYGKGRKIGDLWYDELTDIRAHLYVALMEVMEARQIQDDSPGYYVSSIDIIKAEDDLCVLLGKCVKKMRKIEDLREPKSGAND